MSDRILITPFKNKMNHFLINLQKYKRKKQKNFKDFNSFYSLDIDPKTQVKNFMSFSYHMSYSSSRKVTGEEDYSNAQSPVVGYTPIKIPKKYNKKDKLAASKTDENKNYSKKKCAEKPKYDLKNTFEMDANDINLINEFVDPDPKYLLNSEYLQLDYFLNMEVNQDNYYKIFDFCLNDDREIYQSYYNNNSNEFVNDYVNRFNNSSPKKSEQKLRLMDDYLIFDVDESQFYKKMSANPEKSFQVKGEDSTKVRVKVKKLPIKFLDDHIV